MQSAPGEGLISRLSCGKHQSSAGGDGRNDVALLLRVKRSALPALWEQTLRCEILTLPD
ncbi:hypothetical protein L1S32_08235 [Methanogenium sp. S4BF]|uniref:hypothetical protein n=1 Tax=Methanogenium sp. S4BF TaxID=1789226 RepID=UPI00241664C0|nr:hypothetical protein [Methanogenium sp. S4BF]WFN33829.1 hypothetical protein L1S32_08235 [Methanogenium sp. S4BF]